LQGNSAIRYGIPPQLTTHSVMPSPEVTYDTGRSRSGHRGVGVARLVRQSEAHEPFEGSP
jgi:hypothetical protein